MNAVEAPSLDPPPSDGAFVRPNRGQPITAAAGSAKAAAKRTPRTKAAAGKRTSG